MSELSLDRNGATELGGPAAATLLEAVAGQQEREALVRFLAGRDERPCQGAFASLSPDARRSKE